MNELKEVYRRAVAVQRRLDERDVSKCILGAAGVVVAAVDRVEEPLELFLHSTSLGLICRHQSAVANVVAVGDVSVGDGFPVTALLILLLIPLAIRTTSASAEVPSEN